MKQQGKSAQKSLGIGTIPYANAKKVVRKTIQRLCMILLHFTLYF